MTTVFMISFSNYFVLIVLSVQLTLGVQEPFDACHQGCKCFNLTATTGLALAQQAPLPLSALSTARSDDDQPRYAVHCKESELYKNWVVLFSFDKIEVDFLSLARGIPSNTTDLVVSSFNSPLNLAAVLIPPWYDTRLLTITVDGCTDLTIQPNVFYGSLLFNLVKQITIANNVVRLSTEILKRTFDGLLYVENITIVKNTVFDTVQSESFRALPRLQILNLSNNKIFNIQPNFIENAPALTTLDLSHNFLSDLPGDDILTLLTTSLKHLLMAGNRWNCSCELSWILVLNKSVLADHIPAVCLYPKHLNGTALNQLTTEHCTAVNSLLPINISTQ